MRKSPNRSLKKRETVRKKGGSSNFKRKKNKNLDFVWYCVKIHEPIKNVFS